MMNEKAGTLEVHSQMEGRTKDIMLSHDMTRGVGKLLCPFPDIFPSPCHSHVCLHSRGHNAVTALKVQLLLNVEVK